MRQENNGQKKKDNRGGRREGAGRKPGSGNRMPEELKREAIQYGGEAIQFYRSVLADKKAPMNWKFAAAEQLLDRALGKASQEVTVNRDTNVNVKFETFEEIEQGLQNYGLDIPSRSPFGRSACAVAAVV